MKTELNKTHTVQHRVAFVGAWLAITIALVVFPGSEVRGLAMGLIIGWWPFGVLGGAGHIHPLIELLVMFLLSGAAVGICAWLVDAARLSKRVWIALLLAVAVGAVATGASNRFDFEDWKNSPGVSAAMESPEVNYKPTLWEFYKAIVIPKTLAGGLWGLYAAAAGGCLYAAAVIVLRKRHLSATVRA